jgi:hypothetical protein
MLNSPVSHVSVVRLSLAMIIVLGVLAGLAWQATQPGGAMAQGVDVEISELSCDSDPEMIVVTNKGATPLDMTGWNLQSDPTSSESLALQQFGSLPAGATVTVQAGPSATGSFVWARTEVFRNNDASDFAQLASDAGEVLLKVNCGAAQPATASPTAAGAVSAPTSGGPPGAATAISPALLIALGSWLSTAGLGTLALAFKGIRRREFGSAPAEPRAEARADAALLTTSSKRVTTARSTGYILLVGIAILLGAVLFALQLGGRSHK